MPKVKHDVLECGMQQLRDTGEWGEVHGSIVCKGPGANLVINPVWQATIHTDSERFIGTWHTSEFCAVWDPVERAQAYRQTLIAKREAAEQKLEKAYSDFLRLRPVQRSDRDAFKGVVRKLLEDS